MSSKNNSQLKYWVAFSLVYKVGPIKFAKIQQYFPSLEQAWQASFSELMQAGLDEKIANEIVIKRSEIDPDLEMEKLAAEQVSVLTLEDDDYPKLLREIYGAPYVLYYKGRLDFQADEFSLAVVGTRKFTSYGKQITSDIVQELAAQGLTIISGLALGIDALAHEATLKAEGRTIAVLGSGLDRDNIYPAFNRYLFDKIIYAGGLAVSEYPIGTTPTKFTFPQRNRIISGLSLGTLVIEAPETSGALLTAKHALEQNREIFATPGPIYATNSIGPNNLIKMGAKLVTEAVDVIEALDLNLVKDFVAAKKIVPDSASEAQILEHLNLEPIHVDELVRLTNLDTAVINSTLTLMEMKGRVRNLGGLMYVISR